MQRHIYLLVLIGSFFFIGCKQEQKSKTPKVERQEEVASSSVEIPQDWIERRVNNAKERLSATKAGAVIWQAMEAHGGLQNWFGSGALSFRFNYQPLDGKAGRDSYQTIDVWRNRARHISVVDSTDQFGWTGEKAWLKAKDSTSFTFDTKFWALTPLYLMGHPFVIDGEGVQLELLPQVKYQGKTNDVVKVTFEAGTGDAPDDYYILQFDARSHLITATRYIVSYPEYFKDGGHNPEKFMEIGQLTKVGGILLPTSLKTYWTKDGQPGEYITKIDITEISFQKNLPENYFEMPRGAKVL
ncbi:MAG: hypothetical protein CML04_08110 [Pseudozobellia sp.]|mgnify:CR=1 FL=1|nr:hypothetical protein [Pseudozobellia sp.]MBG47795.1 hypothetical protein [Pseudozobellia sp.]|tara:strand:+ start:624 stop:1520 length:897 start_codon:yes stop_codon:yes gene_type:complete